LPGVLGLANGEPVRKLSLPAINYPIFYRYYTNLRTELPPTSDTVYRHRGLPKGITPQEVQGLHAVLSVIKSVAEKVRIFLKKQENYQLFSLQLGFLLFPIMDFSTGMRHLQNQISIKTRIR